VTDPEPKAAAGSDRPGAERRRKAPRRGADLRGVEATEGSGTRNAKAPWGDVSALAFSHGANDMYMGFLPALLPLIVVNLGLDYKGAGILVSVVTLTSQFSQPLFGFLGDRVGRRTIAIAAPVLTGLSMSFLGLATGYGVLLSLLILGSIGTAAFHPQGAALVGAVSRRRGSVAMALFTGGGSFGYGAGSILIALVVAHLGYTRTWLALPIGLAAALSLARAVPRSAESAERRAAERSAASPERWLLPLIVLYLIVMLRAATATTFTTFVPILMERRGETLILGGWALFGFSLAGAAGGILGGRLSETLGQRAVTIAGFALTAPALYLFLHAGGFPSVLLLFVTGACLLSALPVNIVMGQALLPRHASTVSGIIMGVAWGVGGLGATALGALADHWSASMGEVAGLARAMDLVALLPLAACLLSVTLPGGPTRSRRRRRGASRRRAELQRGAGPHSAPALKDHFAPHLQPGAEGGGVERAEGERNYKGERAPAAPPP